MLASGSLAESEVEVCTVICDWDFVHLRGVAQSLVWAMESYPIPRPPTPSLFLWRAVCSRSKDLVGETVSCVSAVAPASSSVCNCDGWQPSCFNVLKIQYATRSYKFSRSLPEEYHRSKTYRLDRFHWLVFFANIVMEWIWVVSNNMYLGST